MRIFGSIMDKIFHRGHGAATTASPSTSTTGAPTPSVASGQPAATASTPAGSGAPPSVDVEAVLSGLAAKAGQKLDWRKSIVDLLKLLDLDSSLAARKELARELHYSGDSDDSAKMNVWLHRQVMQKLAENGGKVPESLRT